MARTRAWDNNSPIGNATSAKDIDQEIRSLKLDIDERMAEIGTGFSTAGPLILNPEYKGNATKTLIIPFAAFGNNSSTTANSTLGHLVSAIDSNHFAPIFLPPGVTITDVTVSADKNTAAGWQWFLYRTVFTVGGAATPIFTSPVIAGAGVISSSSGALALLVDANHVFTLAFDATGGAGVAYITGAKVTYTVPDTRNTI